MLTWIWAKQWVSHQIQLLSCCSYHWCGYQLITDRIWNLWCCCYASTSKGFSSICYDRSTPWRKCQFVSVRGEDYAKLLIISVVLATLIFCLSRESIFLYIQNHSACSKPYFIISVHSNFSRVPSCEQGVARWMACVRANFRVFFSVRAYVLHCDLHWGKDLIVSGGDCCPHYSSKLLLSFSLM